MPVELLVHMRISTPALHSKLTSYRVSRDMEGLIDSYMHYELSPALPHRLLITDGRPLVCLLVDNACCKVLAGDKESCFQGGFLSGSFMENTYLQPLPNQGSLLIIQFSEQGLYHLLGRSLRAYRTRSLWSLAEVFGRDYAFWVEQLSMTNSIAGKIMLIEDLIGGRTNSAYELNNTFKKAVYLIRQAEGQVQIETLCQKLGVSYKWLERNFTKYLGMAPKEYARLQRFLRAYLTMSNSFKQDMLSIAIDCGYYDQNHFIKDFKRFTGQTPAYYLSK